MNQWIALIKKIEMTKSRIEEEREKKEVGCLLEF